MTNIKICQKNGKIVSFKVSGHSGYAENGSDIVCASISTLAQSTILGISEVLGIKCNTKINENLPMLSFEFFKNTSKEDIENSQTLLSTFKLSVENLSKQFKKYISLEVEDEIY